MTTHRRPELGMPRVQHTVAPFFGALILLAGCSMPQTSVPPATVECPECPEVVCPEPVRYEDLWASFGHADEKSEAFAHWNEDDPPEVPVACAQCHSRPGFLDYLGIDGTEAGVVDSVAKIGTTVTCFVCHNEATMEMDRAVFVSGNTIRGLGAEARLVAFAPIESG